MTAQNKSLKIRAIVAVALFILVSQLLQLFPLTAYSLAERVQLGGFPIGLNLRFDGVVVVCKVAIETNVGLAYPVTQIAEGDVITAINGNKVSNATQVSNEIQKACQYDSVDVSVMRNGKEMTVSSTLLVEDLSGKNKLGLGVKEFVNGVGTVTFIKPNGEFACLGHAIAESRTGCVTLQNGDAYECKVVGLTKASKGQVGEIKGYLRGNSIGEITENSQIGVFGKLCKPCNSSDLIEVATVDEVQPGNAEIVCCPRGVPERYKIEIIKANRHNLSRGKNLVIRVTDKRLLELTGGILQGMSGSPIIQNGKLVGAVTHVFVCDATKGYGVYAESMLNKMLK